MSSLRFFQFLIPVGLPVLRRKLCDVGLPGSGGANGTDSTGRTGLLNSLLSTAQFMDRMPSLVITWCIPMLNHHSRMTFSMPFPCSFQTNFLLQEKTESAGSETPEEADEKVEPMIPTSPGSLVGMFQCMDGIDALRHLQGTVWDQSTRHAGSRMIG